MPSPAGQVSAAERDGCVMPTLSGSAVLTGNDEERRDTGPWWQCFMHELVITEQPGKGENERHRPFLWVQGWWLPEYPVTWGRAGHTPRFSKLRARVPRVCGWCWVSWVGGLGKPAPGVRKPVSGPQGEGLCSGPLSGRCPPPPLQLCPLIHPDLFPPLCASSHPQPPNENQ